jgi:AbrB family looped-hinge helix DNA binding protein
MQISERGQVTIPKAYRARFGFLPHTEVEFTTQGNQLVLTHKQQNQVDAIRALRGRKKTGMGTDELMDLLRRGD